MKKSRTFKMFSVRAAMLMFAAMFSAGAWAQTTTGTIRLYPDGAGHYKAEIWGNTESDVDNPQGAGTMLSSIECVREFKNRCAGYYCFTIPYYWYDCNRRKFLSVCMCRL